MHLINLEGIDGSGKTTQADLLGDVLQKAGHKIEIIKQPGTTIVGNKIREILKDDDTKKELEVSKWGERFLFAADNATLIANKFAAEKESDKIFICDRNSFISDIAYGSFGLGLEIGKLLKIHNIVDPLWKIRDSAISIILDLSLDEALDRMKSRGSFDRIEARGETFLEKVIYGYRKIAKNTSYVGDVHLVDGAKPIDDVHHSVMNIVTKTLDLPEVDI